MPVGKVYNLEWLNHNSQRNYPLADDASGLDQTGGFQLPDDFIVELDLPVHAGMDVDPARFFVYKLATFATGFSVEIGYQPSDGSDPVSVATALISRSGHTRNTSYALGGVEPFDDTMGKIVIGRFDEIDLQPPGFWTFDFEAGRLDPDAVRPMIRGVTGIVVVKADGSRSERFQGDIELQEGANFQIVPIVVAGQPVRLQLNAVEGAGLNEKCVCEGEELTEPITSINAILPTSAGDFFLLGTECLAFEPIEGGLKAVDTCAAPCCGCPELEAITEDLERLKIERTTTQAFVDRLQTAVDTFSLTVLGARLGDRGCVTCE